MGRGDRRTKKGKIFHHSYGKCRLHKKATTESGPTKGAPKPKASTDKDKA